MLASCGSYNEEGFIKGLFRKGFTHTRCLAELIANTIDAAASNCKFVTNNQTIKMIDDGIGMDENNITNMFDMHRANHTADQSMGVSGLGAKPATAILSKLNGLPTEVIIYTHKENKKYYKVVIPWNTITETNKYTGMIQIGEMDENERNNFDEERTQTPTISSPEFSRGTSTPFGNCVPLQYNDCVSGTTIQFQYNQDLHNAIEHQFTDEVCYMSLDDRWCSIFGKTELNIWYESVEIPNTKMEMYNYFSCPRIEYYKGYDIEVIDHYKDVHNNDRFIWTDKNDVQYEFAKTGRGFDRDMSQLNEKTHKWKKQGIYNLYIGMQKNRKLFDDENVENTPDPFASQNNITLCDYDNKFIHIKGKTNNHGHKDIIKEYLSKVSIVRNGQVITRVVIEGNKASSARADAETMIKIVHLRCEISYNTHSSQDNAMDICMGIQENKNQHSGILPTTFSRLISELKYRKFEEIKNYFKDKIEAYKLTLTPEAPTAITDWWRNPSPSPIVNPSQRLHIPVVLQPQPDHVILQPQPDPVLFQPQPDPVVLQPQPDPDILPPPHQDPVILPPQSDPIPPKPVDVKPHRRICVTGKELIDELQKLIANLDTEMAYSGGYVQFYNFIQSIN